MLRVEHHQFDNLVVEEPGAPIHRGQVQTPAVEIGFGPDDEEAAGLLWGVLLYDASRGSWSSGSRPGVIRQDCLSCFPAREERPVQCTAFSVIAT